MLKIGNNGIVSNKMCISTDMKGGWSEVEYKCNIGIYIGQAKGRAICCIFL
jgi:hypothetical protein